MRRKIAFFCAVIAAAVIMTSCANIDRYSVDGEGKESAAESAQTDAAFAESTQTDAAAETRASEGLNLAVTKDNTGSFVVLTGIGNCTDGVVVIPEEYEGLPVREIKKSAFDSCDSITEVIIPASVTKIGHFAFRNCPRLEKAALGCVAEIGLSMFEDCVSLNTVVLPDGMVEIPSFMLKGCASLGSIHIPESVKIIRDEAFFGCSSLSEIKLPSGLKSICAGAFSGCTSLTVGDDFLPPDLVFIGVGILDYPGEIPPMRCAPWSKFWENEDGTRFGTYDYYVGKYLICLRTGENRYEIKEGTALLPECTFLSDYRLDFTLVIPESVTALSKGWQRIPNYKVEYKGSRQQWENIPRYNALGNRLPEIDSEDRSIVITFMK